MCGIVQYVNTSDQMKITSEARKQATVTTDDTKFWEAEIPGGFPEQKDISAKKGKWEVYVDSANWFTWQRMVLTSKELDYRNPLFMYSFIQKRVDK